MNAIQRQINEVEDAANGDNESQSRIAETGLHILTTLLRKNRDYGDTAQRVPELALEVPAETAIRVRLSDKVARVKQLLKSNNPQVKESLSDSFLDLAGYSILEVIALGEKNKPQWEEPTPLTPAKTAEELVREKHNGAQCVEWSDDRYVIDTDLFNHKYDLISDHCQTEEAAWQSALDRINAGKAGT